MEVQIVICGDADRVGDALAFQVFVELGLGERGVTPEIDRELIAGVLSQYWGDEVLPAVGAVDVSRPELGGLAVAELVEGEDRMVAAALEVAVVG